MSIFILRSRKPFHKFGKTFFFLIYCAIILLNVNIAQVSIRNFTPKDGLTMGYITTLHQDRNGYVWAGTFFGLNRWDGRKMTTYTPNHRSKWSLHANHIHHISEDSVGLLWIGTDNGLAVMDPVSERIGQLQSFVPSFPSFNTLKTFICDQQKLWFYQEHQGKVKLYSVQTGHNLRNEVQNGKLDPALILLDSITFPSTLTGGIHLFQPKSGFEIILADRKGKFFLVDLRKKTITQVPLEGISLPLASGIRFIRNEITGGGTLISPDQNFENAFTADHMQEIAVDREGNGYLFRFYNQEIKLADQILAGKATPDQAKTFATIDSPASMARLIDANGNLWIGTIGNGLRKTFSSPSLVQTILPGVNTYNLAVLPDGKVWPGTYHHDIVYNPTTRNTEEAPWAKSLPTNHAVSGIVCPVNRNDYFLLLNDKTKQVFRLFHWKSDTRTLRDCKTILKTYVPTPAVLSLDGFEQIWISGGQGEVVRYHIPSGTSRTFQIGQLFPPTAAAQLTTRDVRSDQAGNLWISTNFGLVRMWNLNKTPEMESFHNQGKEGILFSNNSIFAIEPDDQDPNTIWLGTLGGGLAAFHYRDRSIEYYQYDKGQKFLLVLGIVRDQAGNLWCSTDKGISCFHPKKKRFISYRYQKELQEYVFSAAAYGVLKDGKIAFGGGQGIYCFDADALLTVEQKHFPIISGVQVLGLNPEVLREDKKMYIVQESGIPLLTVSHELNNITFHIASPLATSVDGQFFTYNIQGITNGWVDVPEDGHISLSGMPPGNYHLQVSLKDNEKVSELQHPLSTFDFVILPPWYKSTMAYIGYCLLFLCIVIGVFMYDRKRLILQHEAALSKEEMSRLQSLDQFKNNFFAFIAHEFKSPLTIILGISEKIRSKVTTSKEINPLIDTVQKESNHLLELIHEMIDITKIQDSSIEFHHTSNDFHEFMQQLVQSWQSIADVKKIQLVTDIPATPNTFLFDTLRYRHIFNNLISNALRYTEAEGMIFVKVWESDDMVHTTIKDTGTGMLPEELDQIFAKYYKESNNNNNNRFHFGLGLTLVKELVSLLHGEIEVESEENQGTTFVIHLPMIGKERSIVSEAAETGTAPSIASTDISEVGADTKTQSWDKPLVLLVDDDLAILAYMKSVLATDFDILLAKDGQEGLDLALREIPDIIVTDVVMPKKDGLEMTHALKTHALTSHIPVIMLSIKSAVEDRLTGQLQGADFYMSKPFLGQELLLALQNMHNLQKKWKERYSSPVTKMQDYSPESSEASSLPMQHGDAFMDELYQIFEQNLNSDTLDIRQICQEMHISRSQLQRKLAAITGATPMELLRDFRLERAKQLLETTPDMTIKEISFQTGFKQPSHFTRLFLQKYGVAPSDIRKRKM